MFYFSPTLSGLTLFGFTLMVRLCKQDISPSRVHAQNRCSLKSVDIARLLPFDPPGPLSKPISTSDRPPPSFFISLHDLKPSHALDTCLIFSLWRMLLFPLSPVVRDSPPSQLFRLWNSAFPPFLSRESSMTCCGPPLLPSYNFPRPYPLCN